MRVIYKDIKREYDLSLVDFLKVFNEEALRFTASNVGIRKVAPFKELVDVMSVRLQMKKVDVIRVLSVLLQKSMVFRMNVWMLPIATNKGNLMMRKASGWAPLESFDTMTVRGGLVEESINKIVAEVI